MTENSMEQLNPRVADIQIGIRNIRTIRIYPLSIHDQEQLVERLQAAVNEFFASGTGGDMEFVMFIIDLIKRNIEEILSLVSDMKKSDLKSAMKEIDNFQLAEIARTIYERNFEAASKNLGGLRELVVKMLKPSIPQRPLPPLQSVTASTSTGSSGEASGPEA